MSVKKSGDVLLKETLERLEKDFDQFSTLFYENLFRRAPELRSMFREDLTGQGMKFIRTLREIVLHVNDAKRESERLKEPLS